jgi:hypothetical protein
MELLYTLNNGNNKDNTNKNLTCNNDDDNILINNNKYNNITDYKIKERNKAKKSFNVLIIQQEVIITYINNNRNKNLKYLNNNSFVTNNYLVYKIKRLSAKNKNLEKIIYLLKNIITTIKKKKKIDH